MNNVINGMQGFVITEQGNIPLDCSNGLPHLLPKQKDKTNLIILTQNKKSTLVQVLSVISYAMHRPNEEMIYELGCNLCAQYGKAYANIPNICDFRFVQTPRPIIKIDVIGSSTNEEVKLVRIGKIDKYGAGQYAITNQHTFETLIPEILDKRETVISITDHNQTILDLDYMGHLVPKDKMKTEGFRIQIGAKFMTTLLNIPYIRKNPSFYFDIEEQKRNKANIPSNDGEEFVLLNKARTTREFRDYNINADVYTDFICLDSMGTGLFQNITLRDALNAHETGDITEWSAPQIAGFYSNFAPNCKCLKISKPFKLTVKEIMNNFKLWLGNKPIADLQ